MESAQKISIQIDPRDVGAVLAAARRAVDQRKLDTEGDEFDALAAIGAVDAALRRAQSA